MPNASKRVSCCLPQAQCALHVTRQHYMRCQLQVHCSHVTANAGATGRHCPTTRDDGGSSILVDSCQTCMRG